MTQSKVDRELTDGNTDERSDLVEFTMAGTKRTRVSLATFLIQFGRVSSSSLLVKRKRKNV